MKDGDSAGKIVIKGSGYISPIGKDASESGRAFASGASFIRTLEVEGCEFLGAALSASSESALMELRSSDRRFASLDKTALMAIYAARTAYQASGWKSKEPLLVNIGSSRGATSLFESYYRSYLASDDGKTQVLTSPTTTLGNISSWVLQDLKSEGIAISHSMTCSTGLQAIANGIAWIRSGLVKRAIVGASEAPLTGFTIAQMKALRVYANEKDSFPCRPFSKNRVKGCGMVLGEGAGAHAIELAIPVPGEVVIDGFGLSSEVIDSPTSISESGQAFSEAMRAALQMAGRDSVDAVIAHAPGTPAGDSAEIEAIGDVFTSGLPAVLSNKWIIGHTFAASGTLSMELAQFLLSGGKAPNYPYDVEFSCNCDGIRSIMINSAGFGGNAGSVILSRAGAGGR